VSPCQGFRYPSHVGRGVDVTLGGRAFGGRSAPVVGGGSREEGGGGSTSGEVKNYYFVGKQCRFFAFSTYILVVLTVCTLAPLALAFTTFLL